MRSDPPFRPTTTPLPSDWLGSSWAFPTSAGVSGSRFGAKRMVAGSVRRGCPRRCLLRFASLEPQPDGDGGHSECHEVLRPPAPSLNTVAIYVVLVVFVATLIRSSLGFGEALVAVPLLALGIPVQVAAPLAVLVSVTIAAMVIAQDWRSIHLRSAGWLVLATLAGIPIGLWLLVRADPRLVKGALAVALVSFATYSLRRRPAWHLTRESLPWMLGCGFIAGVFGGAYGMNGPPLAVYGSMRRWSAAHFRATLQAYFLPASVIGMVGYWLAGLWVPLVTRYYVISLPVTVVATLLGRVIHRRMQERNFLRYVYGGLLAIGVVLLIQSLGFWP